jgi:hypothetical protein
MKKKNTTKKTVKSPSKSKVERSKAVKSMSLSKGSGVVRRASSNKGKIKNRTKSKKSINSKIALELAIGVILVVAIAIGGIFWLDGIGNEKLVDNSAGQIVKSVEDANQTKTENENGQIVENACKPHYYEGEKEIKGWFVSQDENGIIVAVNKDEFSKLPTDVSQLANNEDNFNLKLVDPTDEIGLKIKASSKEKPTTFTIHGYAEICQQPPLMSLQPATVAFRKQS